MSANKKTAGIIMGVIFVLMILTATEVFADQVKLNASFGKPYMLSGEKELNYLKVSLTGFDIKNKAERTLVNIAIVLDKSGSMQGSKIENAKKAAIMAIERLGKDDIVSVVTYDTNVDVLVPATKARDLEKIRSAIRGIKAGSSTALFAGVSKGAAEVRKFLDKKKVNRVILLSDGLANQGPSTPSELTDLGRSLIKEGISVTTFGLGLGYNEDLMSQLASSSDGNHAFIERPEDLITVFNYEFGDVLSVVAQDVKIAINCKNIRPVRGLGRDVEIRGNMVTASINQLYANQEKYILLEVEVNSTSLPDHITREKKTSIEKEQYQPGSGAEITMTYFNMMSEHKDTLTTGTYIKFTNIPMEVEKNENKDVMISSIKLLANEAYETATKLRDIGKIEEAKIALKSNAVYLKKNAEKYKSVVLDEFSTTNNTASESLEGKKWGKTRKQMRYEQNKNKMQQKY